MFEELIDFFIVFPSSPTNDSTTADPAEGINEDNISFPSLPEKTILTKSIEMGKVRNTDKNNRSSKPIQELKQDIDESLEMNSSSQQHHEQPFIDNPTSKRQKQNSSNQSFLNNTNIQQEQSKDSKEPKNHHKVLLPRTGTWAFRAIVSLDVEWPIITQPTAASILQVINNH
jgi:hypothetical protein